MSTSPTLVMLHGARGTHKELMPLAQAMAGTCMPYLSNLLGHGGRPIPDRLSVDEMAQDILRQMDLQGVETTYLFGYSLGGYIALYLARHAPKRIKGVCTLATKILYDDHTVALLTHLSRPERIRNRHQAVMSERHPGQNWERLVSGLSDLYRKLGQNPALTETDLRSITVPSLTVTGNNDQLVPWSESLRLAYLMPKGQGFTFAGKAHPFQVIPIPLLATVIADWLACVSSMESP